MIIPGLVVSKVVIVPSCRAEKLCPIKILLYRQNEAVKTLRVKPLHQRLVPSFELVDLKLSSL